MNIRIRSDKIYHFSLTQLTAGGNREAEIATPTSDPEFPAI